MSKRSNKFAHRCYALAGPDGTTVVGFHCKCRRWDISVDEINAQISDTGYDAGKALRVLYRNHVAYAEGFR